MLNTKDSWDVKTDIIVVGSGSGALTSAIVGRECGAEVFLLETTDKIGGGTAYSGGMLWIANNPHMLKLGIKDSRENALTYIRHTGGGHHVEDLTVAFIDTAPEMLEYIEEKAGMEMEVIRPCPDYYPEHPGGTTEGRALQPKIFDSKRLGDWQNKLRLSPHLPIPSNIPELIKWGGYCKISNWDWGLLAKRMEDGIVGFGSSLIGHLMKACLDREVNIMLQTRGIELVRDDTNRIVGIKAEQEGRTVFIQGRLGIILACGGYEWNENLRRLNCSPTLEASTPPSNCGDGHIMALEAGAAWAHLDESAGTCLAIPGETHEGKTLYRIFVEEPARPGMIMVNQQGKRFTNEGMYKTAEEDMVRFDGSKQIYPNLPCYLIYDHNHKTKYVFGSVMPDDNAPEWMNCSSSLRELALKLAINPDTLDETVNNFNSYARKGKDPEFHRGDSAYARFWGDPFHKPNPSLGTIEKPPFYGFKAIRSVLGTKSGLVTNANAQVINVRGEPIQGLYAVPNTAAHLALGRGMTSGQTLAQSMTFGYIAAKHMTK
ncbi:MAG: FAD-binding protein [Proteobacteria bacterium]|nr:FAD-binding protein [Pseudomonadota bacterium]